MKKAIVIMSVLVMSLGIAAVLYFNGVFSLDFTSPEAAAGGQNPDTAVSDEQTTLPDQTAENSTQNEDTWTDDNTITTTQTQKSTNEETTTKQTTTTTKSFFDIFTPKTTTTTKKTTTTTSNRTQTSTTNSTRSTITTTTTKATTTTTKATQAQKTDYSISFNGSLAIDPELTNSALYTKWYNSDITAQGSLFGAGYVIVKGTYGSSGFKCSNSSKTFDIKVTSNNTSIVSVAETWNGSLSKGFSLKANSTGKATITASIPNNTKTFSFTVAVVTEDQVISTYEKEAMRLINQYRSNAGVDPLQADNGMKQTAEIRAKECMQKFQSAMAAGQTSFTAEFAHSRPDGSPYSRAFPDKYLHGGWLVNENVAVGYEVPVSMCRGWYNSSGHRTTMLSTHYDRGYVGLSIADNGRFYWTLEVAGLSNATVEGGEVSEEDKAIEPVRD